MSKENPFGSRQAQSPAEIFHIYSGPWRPATPDEFGAARVADTQMINGRPHVPTRRFGPKPPKGEIG